MYKKPRIAKYYDTLVPKTEMFYVTRLGNGILTSDPDILKQKVVDAYVNIISRVDAPKDTYEICFTVIKDQLIDNKDIAIHAVFYVPEYKNQNKYIIHKLKRFKKIINSKRYYHTTNITELIDICKKAIELITVKKAKITFGPHTYNPITYNAIL